jgi:hypothetical protein
VKKDWIERMKKLSPNDSQYKVVFTDDEEIHGDNVKLQVSGTRAANKAKNIPGKPN